MEERGHILNSEYGKTLVTIHPSARLRWPESFEPEFERFIADLRMIHTGATVR